MKLKSFLFLAAAPAVLLVLGLAFASCGGDTETVTNTVKQGYASDADAINAAFEFASDVYLTKETDLTTGGVPLVIPASKTLHVNGQKVKVGSDTIIIVAGSLDLKEEGSVIYSEVAGAVLVNVTDQLDTQANLEAHYGSASTPYTAGTVGLVFVKNDGTPKDTDTNRYIAGDADTVLANGALAATGAGTIGIVTGNVSTGGAYNIGAGTLLVAGNFNFGTGPVTSTGLIMVYGELKGGTAANTAYEVIKGNTGAIIAKSATIIGGSISNPLSVRDASTFGAATGGTLVTFGAKLEADEGALVTFASPAKFIAAADIGKAEFKGNAEFAPAQSEIEDAKFSAASPTVTGYLAVKNLSGTVTVTGGSLSTESELTLNSGLTIILGASGGIEFTGSGKLTGTDKYEINGAGSLLNDATDAGSTVTFAASEITNSGAAAYIPTIVFGSLANLVYKDSAEISGLNLDVSDGGSISMDSASTTLTLTGGGSITAKTVTGTLGTGKLYIVTNSAGSLVAGTLYGDDAPIDAGSYGTFAKATNFIYSGVTFELAGTKAAYGIEASEDGIDDDTGGAAITDKVLAVFDDTE
jgi:hypothetical protein